MAQPSKAPADAIDREIERMLALVAQQDVDYAQACLDEIKWRAHEGGKSNAQRILFLCERVLLHTPKPLHGRFWVIWRMTHEKFKDLRPNG